MTTTTTMPRQHDLEVTTPPRPRRHVLRHFVEMVLAMAIGMMVMGGLVSAGFAVAGLDTDRIAPELDMLLMVSVGMTLWMRFRRHRWPVIFEMDAAMFAPPVALFPLLWADAISEDAMYGLGHVAMLPAMLAVLLRHRDDLSSHSPAAPPSTLGGFGLGWRRALGHGTKVPPGASRGPFTANSTGHTL